MTEDDHALMMQVFSSVFENFAFMFVEDDPEEEEVGAQGPFLQAEISFKSKDVAGVMEIAAPVGFCNELAENILGDEGADIPEGAGENALKEVLNVSCGYLLAEKFGTEEVFDLSIPKIRGGAEKQWHALLEGGAYDVFLIDEAPLLARLVLQP